MVKSKKSDSGVQYGLPRITVHQKIADISRLKAALETQRERINWAQLLLGIPVVWTSTMGKV
ncbi:MAG: hypothetical protein JRF50_11900 [Deltaproteobacteria bacterium]|nr:hypothetical protein [Deltaproteobacteria bacterium]